MRRFLLSFKYAFNGLVFFFRFENNGKIQLVISLLVVAAGLYFHLSSTEWIAICTCIGLVLSLEMMNSALEKLCNLVQPDYHPAIKHIKDIAAAAVLLASIISSIIGAIILIPKIFP